MQILAQIPLPQPPPPKRKKHRETERERQEGGDDNDDKCQYVVHPVSKNSIFMDTSKNCMNKQKKKK